MLDHVSRALAQLFKPITTVKSDADRDPAGNAFEKFTPPKKEDAPKEENSGGDQKGATSEPAAQVIPFKKQTPNEVVEAHKREIRNSQAWLGLVNLFQGKKSTSSAAKEGPEAYEQGASSKKGVIVDKKAG